MPNENENVYVAPPERLPSPPPASPSPSPSPSASASQSESQSHHNDALNPCQSASPSPSRAPSTRNMSEAELRLLRLNSSLFGGSTCACLANIVWAVRQPHLTRSQNVANVFAALHLFCCIVSIFLVSCYPRDSFGPSNCELMSKMQLYAKLQPDNRTCLCRGRFCCAEFENCATELAINRLSTGSQ